VVLLNAQVYGLGWNMYVSNFIAIVLVSFWNFGLTLKFGWTGGWTGGTVPLKTPHGTQPQVDADERA
jgi:hypothetical protein